MSPRPASGAPRPLSPLRAVALFVIVSMAAPHAQSLQGTRRAQQRAGAPAAARVGHRASAAARRPLDGHLGGAAHHARVADHAQHRRCDGDLAEAAAAARQGAGHDLDVRVGPGRRHHPLRSRRAARSQRAVGAAGAAVPRRERSRSRATARTWCSPARCRASTRWRRPRKWRPATSRRKRTSSTC